MSQRLFRRLYPPAATPEGDPFWLLFRGTELVVPAGDPLCLLEDTSCVPTGVEIDETLLLGSLDGRPCLTGTLPADSALPEGFQALNLRAVLAQADSELATLAGYATVMLHWARTSRFCPACSQSFGPIESTWGRTCANCGHTMYPPVSPAVIVLIHDGERALLASRPGSTRYSLIAGFVEPGETFEECVAREVREEVGVEVDELRYISSQAWPFPHQIMVGFTARYTAGAIEIDATELAHADWFPRDALPDLPPPYTIARQIIEHWRAEIGNRVAG